MPRTLTNNFSLSYGIEPSLGADPTAWFLLEPNDITGFGATVTTVARDPISKSRQRRKGTATDLDSAVEFPHDLTLSGFRAFAEGFVFSTGINSNVTNMAADEAVDGGVGADSFELTAALSAAQADKFEIDTLIWVQGFSNSANNGLFALTVDAAAGTALSVATGTLVAETGATARISIAGHRVSAGDIVTWDWNAAAKTATLNSAGIVAALQALGLTVGQIVHIGSPDGSGGVQNAFQNVAANDVFGYARVKSFSGADNVVFDGADAALQFDDLTDPATAVDVLFGEFIRNVAVDNAAFLERSFMFEGAFKDLLTGPADGFQYAKGNFANSMAIALPLSEKATVTFGFIGTDTDNPVGVASRKAGASTASAPTETAAFNTSSEILRLRVQDIDETGLSTDFKSATLTLLNNVSPEKVLAQLGAKFMNFGNFQVNLETQLVFTNSAVIDRIRDNTTVRMDFILRNGDGGIAIDIPSLTLGGGGRDFPRDESILINLTGEAHEDSTLGTSIGISIFPVVPQLQA